MNVLKMVMLNQFSFNVIARLFIKIKERIVVVIAVLIALFINILHNWTLKINIILTQSALAIV